VLNQLKKKTGKGSQPAKKQPQDLCYEDAAVTID
jgi:hypothetical protein